MRFHRQFDTENNDVVTRVRINLKSMYIVYASKKSINLETMAAFRYLFTVSTENL